MPIDPVDPACVTAPIAAAQGREPFDLLLTGGTLVDVGCGELRAADVGFVGPLVASVHEPGTRTDSLDALDCTGRFVAPGLIDLHVHFESSMLTPGAYAEAVCPRGTTTVFADPHELANVAGVKGVRYAVEASRGLPVRFIVQAPSCVPPQPGLELSGADLFGPDVERMLRWPEVGGLAEVMDMLGVLSSDDRMGAVVAAGLASGKLVSGHAAGLTGPALQGYLAAGITSDHEIFTEPDCLEKLRAGHDRRAARRARRHPAEHRRGGEPAPDPADAPRGRDRRPVRAHPARGRRARPSAAPPDRARHGPGARVPVRDVPRRRTGCSASISARSSPVARPT